MKTIGDSLAYLLMIGKNYSEAATSTPSFNGLRKQPRRPLNSGVWHNPESSYGC